MDKRLLWQGELPPFGPPLYDEKFHTYYWRVFKRGAVWGAGLSFVATTQFAAFTHMIEPGKRPMRELMAIPVVYSFCVASFFGVYECFNHP